MVEYLICIDFEATCFPSKYQRCRGWYQEIIDFGAAFIDLSDGRIESTFQSYVQPTEFYLTRGCIRKLDICQGVLDDSPQLQSVLCDFGRWMRQIREEYYVIMPWHVRDENENAYFCTWSNMDLGFYLKNECKMKNINYANYLKWWINGQETFYDVCGRNAKLHAAADCINTPIVGNAHSALDDAQTLAHLMQDLWNNTSFDYNIKTCR